MIRVTGMNDKKVYIEVKYVQEVKTYNVTTEFMSDDCVNYRVEQSNMIWLNDQGEIGEIESIFPKIVQQAPCYFAEQIEYKNAFPLLHIISKNDDFCVQHDHNEFTMWFVKEKLINLQVNYQNIDFFIGNDELLGIHCRHISTV